MLLLANLKLDAYIGCLSFSLSSGGRFQVKVVASVDIVVALKLSLWSSHERHANLRLPEKLINSLMVARR